MIEHIIYFSPFLILFSALLLLTVGRWQQKNLGWNFRLTKIAVVGAFVSAIIFYNKTPIDNLMIANTFTALFLGIMYVGALAVLFLSRKWYASMKVDGHGFCESLLLSLMAGSALIMSNNLGLTVVAMTLLITANYFLLRHADKKKEIYTSRNLYAVMALFVMLFVCVAVGGMYYKYGNLDYERLATGTNLYADNPLWHVGLALVVLGFIFLLGLAPLHFWFTETMGQVILPVFSYFVLVPTAACWAGLIHFNVVVLGAEHSIFAVFYLGLALVSLFVGAVGACSGKNVRKLLAYGVVFHAGIVLLTLRYFTAMSLNGAFIYMFVYMLAMYGICACLYGLKNKGEYLFMLSDFDGAAFRRPYISAMMSVFLFSLIGFPPFLGFLGMFSVLSDLAQNNNFGILIFVLLMLVILTYAYLQIIKTLYFENSTILFDRADSGIYVAILFTLLLMIVIMVHPRYLLSDINFMLEDAIKWL